MLRPRRRPTWVFTRAISTSRAAPTRPRSFTIPFCARLRHTERLRYAAQGQLIRSRGAPRAICGEVARPSSPLPDDGVSRRCPQPAGGTRRLSPALPRSPAR
jgi:hypothetical protein